MGEDRHEYNCTVCRQVREWNSEPNSLVMVREIRGADAMLVYQSPEVPQIDRDCIMQWRIGQANEAEIREGVNVLLGLADEVWLAGKEACSRLA